MFKEVITVEVAIMGAGLSGLACAITLEANGISPTIFEKRGLPGDRFVNAELFFTLFSRPIEDPVAYFSNRHGIYINPVSDITEIKFYSQNHEGTLNGRLGFSNIRGRHPDSTDNQLAKQVKSPITYNSKYTYGEIKKEFTHVILATGDAIDAKDAGNFTESVRASLKGGTVTGDFEVNKTYIWLNNDFAPQGYGYLIPYTTKEAHLAIGYPEYPQTMKEPIHNLWEKFYSQVCKDLIQDFHITDNFEISGQMMGISKYPRVGNTFFTGNCLGSLMPAFGFGQIPSILSGIYAAYDILGLGDYEKLTKKFFTSYKNSLIIRRAAETLDNNDYDKIVIGLKHPVISKIVSNNKYDAFKIASYLLRPWYNLKKLNSNARGK